MTDKIAEIEGENNEPVVDTKEAVKCPNCGSHTIRAFSPEGTNATLVCLTCGTEFQKKVHINPEASIKEAVNVLDPNLHAQIVGLQTQINEAYQSGNQALAKQLNQQLMQLLNNPSQPLTGPQPIQPMHASMDKGSPYPDDSYKNAPDHTPKGQKKWPKEVNAIYNACMRDGKGSGDTKDEKQESCAKIAWAQYEKGKKKSVVDNSTLVDTTDKFFLESTVFEADTVWDGGDDPYSEQRVDHLDDFQQTDPGSMDERNLDYAHCPACDGPGVLLGQLGNRIHYRCRNCGLDFSHKPDTNEPGQAGAQREEPYGAQIPAPTTTPFQASLDDVKVVNQDSLKRSVDSNGNPLVAGQLYTMNNPLFKVPDIVKILNLEDNRIEAAIESDEHGSFPIHIKHDDICTFTPYEKSSGWKYARANFTADEQDELINENPKGKARNFDKLKLDGTHYQVKEEATDPNFLLGW